MKREAKTLKKREELRPNVSNDRRKALGSPKVPKHKKLLLFSYILIIYDNTFRGFPRKNSGNLYYTRSGSATTVFFRSNTQRRDQGERRNFDVRHTAQKDSKKRKKVDK